MLRFCWRGLFLIIFLRQPSVKQKQSQIPQFSKVWPVNCFFACSGFSKWGKLDNKFQLIMIHLDPLRFWNNFLFSRAIRFVSLCVPWVWIVLLMANVFWILHVHVPPIIWQLIISIFASDSVTKTSTNYRLAALSQMRVKGCGVCGISMRTA